MSAAQGMLYVFSDLKTLVALDVEGNVLWRIAVVMSVPGSIAATPTEIWVTGKTGVEAFDARDGTFLASRSFEGLCKIAVQSDGHLLLCGHGSLWTACHRDLRQVWRISPLHLDERVSSIASSNSHTASCDNLTLLVEPEPIFPLVQRTHLLVSPCGVVQFPFIPLPGLFSGD
jgi:hypothetical protein